MAVSKSSSADTDTPPARPEAVAFIDLAAQQARIRADVDRAISRVLDHGQYIMGPEVAELETALARRAGSRHAISCASGTDALLIALMAKGIGPGDAVICPAFTYTATPETIALIGASPVFVDVDPVTFNIDPVQIAAGVAVAKEKGLAPKAVIAVDLYGQPAAYEAIETMAEQHGLWVLSDAAQSFGATCNGRPVGSFGLITATSFFPSKPLGCYGDGGAIFTDDDGLAEIMRSIRLHGKGSDKYDIVRIGVNGRLDTLQAAVLLEKLKIFDDEIVRRTIVADAYRQHLGNDVDTPVLAAGNTSVWAQYTIKVPSGRRSDVAARLQSKGIPTAIHYPKPLHAQSAYREFPHASVPRSAFLAEQVLSLPMHPYLTKDAITRIAREVKNALSGSSAAGG